MLLLKTGDAWNQRIDVYHLNSFHYARQTKDFIPSTFRVFHRAVLCENRTLYNT